MKITIDNQLSHKTVEDNDVRNFIASLNDELITQGKLIERFECNGKVVNFFMASSNPALLCGTDELKIFTKEVNAVVEDAINYSKLELPRFIESLQKICDLARQDKFSDALKAYITIFPYFRLLVMGLIAISGRSKRFSFEHTVLNQTIAEINDALSRNDSVSFSDALEYRTIPELTAIHLKLSNLE